MTYVIMRTYSNFYDQTTDTSFDPVIDQKAGVWIGAANVAPKLAKNYFGPKAAFSVLTDAEYLAIVTPPAPVDVPDPVEPLTGSPLTDLTVNEGRTPVAAPEPPASA